MDSLLHKAGTPPGCLLAGAAAAAKMSKYEIISEPPPAAARRRKVNKSTAGCALRRPIPTLRQRVHSTLLAGGHPEAGCVC